MARYFFAWVMALAVMFAVISPLLDQLQAKQRAAVANHMMQVDAPSAGHH